MLLQRLIDKYEGVVTRFTSFIGRRLAYMLGARVGKKVWFAGLPIIVAGQPGSVVIGDRVSFISRRRGTALGVHQPVTLRCLTEGARIAIGDDTGLSGTVICAAKNITIGNRCLIGANVVMFDTDFHNHSPVNRRFAEVDWDQISKGVVIEDDVFIGTQTIIQKGVTIGRGSIVAANSVVTKSCPPFSVIGGNPARLIRSLASEFPDLELW